MNTTSSTIVEVLDAELRPMQGESLPELASKINAAASAAEYAAREAVARALEAGAMLNKAKAIVGHGGWKLWVAENCVLALRTAQAYMRFSEGYKALAPEEAQRVALLPLREAINAIGTSPESPARHPTKYVQVTTEQRDKTVKSLRRIASAANKARRIAECGTVKEKDFAAVRAALVAAIEALDDVAASSTGGAA